MEMIYVHKVHILSGGSLGKLPANKQKASPTEHRALLIGAAHKGNRLSNSAGLYVTIGNKRHVILHGFIMYLCKKYFPHTSLNTSLQDAMTLKSDEVVFSCTSNR